MTRKIQCTMPDFFDTKVIVAGKEYTIGHDGLFFVEDEHAATLLGNTAKYEDPEAKPAGRPKPGQRARAMPILEDRQGNELSVEQTAKLMPEPPKVEDDPKEEPPPAKWPPVSMAMSKPDMLGLLARLKKAGADVDFKESDTKTELLEVIQKAYDAME